MAHLRDIRVLTLDAAKAMAAAAERFATERGWTIAVAVVDAAGGLILFHSLEDTQPASQEIAVLKARTAARMHRPTKALEEGAQAVICASTGNTSASAAAYAARAGLVCAVLVPQGNEIGVYKDGVIRRQVHVGGGAQALQ